MADGMYSRGDGSSLHRHEEEALALRQAKAFEDILREEQALQNKLAKIPSSEREEHLSAVVREFGAGYQELPPVHLDQESRSRLGGKIAALYSTAEISPEKAKMLHEQIMEHLPENQRSELIVVTDKAGEQFYAIRGVGPKEAYAITAMEHEKKMVSLDKARHQAAQVVQKKGGQMQGEGAGDIDAPEPSLSLERIKKGVANLLNREDGSIESATPGTLESRKEELLAAMKRASERNNKAALSGQGGHDVSLHDIRLNQSHRNKSPEIDMGR